MEAPRDASGPQLCLTDLPAGVLAHIVGCLASDLRDVSSIQITCTDLHDAATVALAARTCWSSVDHREVSLMKAARLFRYLARHCPRLRRISCCFAADRLYGGTLLESSLGCLAAAAAQHLHTLTLLNVDVTDAVMHHLARHCPSLAHLAVGRSQDNAFCSFISDAGLAVVAASCRRLTSLCLFRCYSCTDAGLREVARQQGLQLTALVLHSCPQITAPGLVRFIEATPSLRELDVLLPESSPGGAAVNFDTCFALAAHCSNLQVLRLSEELLSGGVLDDACIGVIMRGCRLLQQLELVQVEVTDAAVADLATHCTQLTSLRLEQTYVGDAGVARVVAVCPHLRELRVAGCSTHSWMLPAEYMFAGLSVEGLRQVAAAAARGAGRQLTSLDLSCLALEQQHEAHEEAVLPAGIAATTVVVNSAANNALAVVSGAGAGGGSESSTGRAHAAAAGQRDDGQPASSDASAAADNNAAGGSGGSGGGSGGSGGGSGEAEQHVLARRLASPLLLLPGSWCQQLVQLSLDWLKDQGGTLQEPLAATLRCCSRLTRLSVVGYQGGVDGLLLAAADAGAALTQLNLQHSQVTDAGLSIAARHFPALSRLFLSYCRLIGDAGLAAVLDMAALQQLDLYNTPCVSTTAVALIAGSAPALRRIFIGHNTSALNRSPAQSSAMGFIGSSERAKHASSNKGSVWAAVSEAAARRSGGHAQLCVLCRNPSAESEFEQGTLQRLLQGG